jgi:hypothetical protein
MTDISRKDLKDGDLVTITPRVRFALWVTEVVKDVTRHWSVCPAGDLGLKLTVSQHGPHSYTITVYARSEERAYDDAMAAIERQERLYGVAENLDAVRKDALACED